MSMKVVIIGGGYSGTHLAASLDKSFDVTLVAGAEVFRHFVAGLRSTVVLENTPRMLIPYDNLLKRGTVKTCLATKINAEACTVTIATGEDLPYDYLVLATGILHPKTGVQACASVPRCPPRSWLLMHVLLLILARLDNNIVGSSFIPLNVGQYVRIHARVGRVALLSIVRSVLCALNTWDPTAFRVKRACSSL